MTALPPVTGNLVPGGKFSVVLLHAFPPQLFQREVLQNLYEKQHAFGRHLPPPRSRSGGEITRLAVPRGLTVPTGVKVVLTLPSTTHQRALISVRLVSLVRRDGPPAEQ